MADSGRVLIADDDETFLQSTADLLRRERYYCDSVPDAPAAKQKLAENEYDVLIADIKMPGNLGLELIRELPNIAEGMPVILITGYPSVHSAIQSIALPVESYMVKPLDFEQLLRHIRIAINHVQVYRSIRSMKLRLRHWYEDLGSVEELSKGESLKTYSTPLDTFLNLSFQNIFDALSDLKELTRSSTIEDMEKEACHLFNCPKLSLLAEGLRETIDVLEKSKSAFKSQTLGEMRKRIEELVSRKA